jgi:succinyl-diaminopimelate desuccinylase
VLELAQALIRQPTPNPPGEERPLAEYLAGELRRRGVEAHVLPVGGERTPQANVFARVPGRGTRPPLVLCGHLDTVPPGEGAWTRDPYAPAVEGGRLYGLGAADMKGAVAAMAIAAARVAAEATRGRPLAADLLLAFTSGEETSSFGARALAQSGLLRGAAGLVLGEPTANRVGIAEKGGLWLEIVLCGRTAHGSLPHLGANAVAGLAEVLAALERASTHARPPTTDDRRPTTAERGPPSAVGPEASAAAGDEPGQRPAEEALRLALHAPPHPLLGVPTLTPTRASGGVANNVVPDRATATLDVRTIPGQSASAIFEAIERLAAEVADRRGLRAYVHSLGERAALATPPEHPLVRACLAAAEAARGAPAETCGLTGATDATELVPVLGLPFVICGPGEMAQAHHPDEYVDLQALAASGEIYYRLARSLCG